MAIDSKDRRASAIFPGLTWLRGLPSPGSASAADRRQLAGNYRLDDAEAPLDGGLESLSGLSGLSALTGNK